MKNTQYSIKIMPLSEAHRAPVKALLTEPSVTRFYMVPDLPEDGLNRLFDRLMVLSAMEEHFVRAICVDGSFAGLLNDTDWAEGFVELGWAVLPGFQNRGIATAAVELALEALFRRGVPAVRAGAFGENGASLRVMEKCGMTRIAFSDTVTYRGQTHGCVYHEIDRAAWAARQTPSPMG